MKRDWISATGSGIFGLILGSFGSLALYHRVFVRGGVLTVAGLFLLLSAYHHAGFTIKNPAVKRFAQGFGFIVAGGALLILLTAGVALIAQTGELTFAKVIENVREHFWTNILILGVLCWLLISRRPREQSSKF